MHVNWRLAIRPKVSNTACSMRSEKTANAMHRSTLEYAGSSQHVRFDMWLDEGVPHEFVSMNVIDQPGA
jgi:hypothetical protein